MPKKIIRRFLPDTSKIKKHKHLRYFGKFLQMHNLWHLNQYSIATAFSVGLFCAFMPMPFQMLLAASFAIILQANLPLSIALVWISNPITMPPMFYFAYKVGTLFIPGVEQLHNLELSWDSIANHLIIIWQPLLIGTFICGIFSALLANLAIRILWRIWVIRRWNERRTSRDNRKN